jgi:transcriptional regulator with XRE-family HTH domain
MTRYIERQWFAEKLKRAGFKNQRAFADAVNLTSSQMSLLLSGKRRAQMAEVAAIATALGATPAEVAAALGVQYSDPLSEAILKITAAVVDADRVTLYDEHADDFGLEEIEIPFVAYGGSGVAIKTDSASPRFMRGDVLGLYLDADDSALIDPGIEVGREVIAVLENGEHALKLLYPGTKRGLYTLISINPRIPPILDARVAGVYSIDFHIMSGRPPKIR